MSEPTQTIFASLPGEPMPIAQVTATLSRMWAGRREGERRAPSEFRASQMNLILHFGLATPVAEARERFQAAIAFAQQYPCRIIVLCPMGRTSSKRLLEGKLFAQCYIGDNLRSMCSCEALMIGYPTREAGFLSNQVSVWLENDLPTYHWLNRVPAERIRDMHMDFIQRCRRVIIDSSLEDKAILELCWPHGQLVHDLAHARLLPVRQSLGQFLSSFAPADLLRGLRAVEVSHEPGRMGEGRHLLEWCRSCLQDCGMPGDVNKRGKGIAFTLRQSAPGAGCLQLKWSYVKTGGQFLDWQQEGCEGRSTLRAHLHGQSYHMPLQTAFPAWPKTLSEALFFQ